MVNDSKIEKDKRLNISFLLNNSISKFKFDINLLRNWILILDIKILFLISKYFFGLLKIAELLKRFL